MTLTSNDPSVIAFADALSALNQATAVRLAAEQRVADAQFALADAQAAEASAQSTLTDAQTALNATLAKPV